MVAECSVYCRRFIEKFTVNIRSINVGMSNINYCSNGYGKTLSLVINNAGKPRVSS